MREIIEIYTKSKTFNKISEIMKEMERIRKPGKKERKEEVK